MALQFEHFLTEGIAQLSYLIGDDTSGTAAVIDPRPDIEIYLQAARRHQLAITHIFETHIHADFMSGSRELAGATDAKIYASVEGGAKYGFKHESLEDGQTFEFGETVITARHTPGHTPEHMSYLLAEKAHRDMPWGVLSGDSLFVNSAGRPDLMGARQADKLVDQLYDTLRGFYLDLRDDVIIYPGHGKGSPCGASIGDRLQSTIGYERRFNPFLQHPDREDFRKYAMSTAPPEPRYYKRMKKTNADGPQILHGLPEVPGLAPKAFEAAARKRGVVLVDTRPMLAFGGGHIEGALNIGNRAELSVWAGWMLEPDKPILLILDKDEHLEDVVRLFVRTGYTQFAGYLAGGMNAWDKAGLPIRSVGQMPVHEIHNDGRQVQIIDVRSPDEWKEGHIPRARHIFLPELEDRAGELDKNRPVAVYCDSGYRASLGASILENSGFEDVRNVPGSWQAWTHAGYEVAKEEN